MEFRHTGQKGIPLPPPAAYPAAVMANDPQADLCELIARKEAVLVVGTGVSVAASGNAPTASRPRPACLWPRPRRRAGGRDAAPAPAARPVPGRGPSGRIHRDPSLTLPASSVDRSTVFPVPCPFYYHSVAIAQQVQCSCCRQRLPRLSGVAEEFGRAPLKTTRQRKRLTLAGLLRE
jgi:hypothetical protein